MIINYIPTLNDKLTFSLSLCVCLPLSPLSLYFLSPSTVNEFNCRLVNELLSRTNENTMNNLKRVRDLPMTYTSDSGGSSINTQTSAVERKSKKRIKLNYDRGARDKKKGRN